MAENKKAWLSRSKGQALLKMADSAELEAIRAQRLAELQAEHGGVSVDCGLMNNDDGFLPFEGPWGRSETATRGTAKEV